MGYKEAMGQMLDWFQMAGVDWWNLSVLDRGMLGHERPRGRGEVEKSLGWAWVRNRDGHNVYVRPARGQSPWPVVFLDDLPPSKAMGVAKKYTSLVVETSKNNCQVWIRADRPLSEAERATVQRALVSLVGADPGSVSGDHFGRAAGFQNRKVGRNDFVVQVLAATHGKALDPAPHLVQVPTTPAPAGRAARAAGGGGEQSESEKEYRYCLARLGWARARGRDPGGEIPFLVGNVADRAVERGKRKTRAEALRYAELTVRRALQALLPRSFY